jgi:hypothetical protein
MKSVKNSKFPALSSEVKRLKETEGGVQVVCEVMQKYIDETVHEERMEKIQKMIRKGCTKEFILELDYTEDEYAEAEAELFQME